MAFLRHVDFREGRRNSFLQRDSMKGWIREKFLQQQYEGWIGEEWWSLRQGYHLGICWSNQSHRFQMLEQRWWWWHWEFKSAQGYRRHLDVTQPSLLDLFQYK